MSCLEGKSVIITGAAKGLGKEFALRAAKMGANIVVNDLDEVGITQLIQEIASIGAKAIPVCGSVSDWHVVENFIGTTVSELGKIDGFVNNAALNRVAYAWDEDEHSIRQVVDVNITGALFCGVQVLKVMTEQHFGSIVNIVSGAHTGLEAQSIYAASKGALASATYCWALEAAQFGVRVNCLSPFANTPMLRKAMSEQTQRYPHLHSAEPEEASAPDAIAPVVTFLLSDLSMGISGQNVRFDSGKINIVAHPRSVGPFEPLSDNDEAEIASVFERSLMAHLKPVGMTGKSLRPAS